MRAFALTLVLVATVVITAGLFAVRSELAEANHSSPGTVDTHIVHVHDSAAVANTGYFHPEPLTPTWADHNAAEADCQVADPPAQCDMNIEAGDSVEWWTKSPFHSLPHTVTECTDNTFSNCSDTADPANPIDDSGIFQGGATQDTLQYGAITFTAPGTYYYRCDVHPDVMRGRVVVAAAQQATPSPSPVPTGTTGPTPTAGVTATPTAAQPAAAPATGGASSDGANWVWLVTALGGLVVVASAAAGLGMLRRR
jgi:plastocyanin